MPKLEFQLDGRVALLTGAGRGIGLAMARTLAAHGAAVAIQDIDHEVAKAEAERITKEGGNAVALGGDLTDLPAVAGWVDEVVRLLGGIHILVNNGSIQRQGHWTGDSVEEMRRQIDANLLAPIVLCQRAQPTFRRQRWGRVVNLGSVQQIKGNESMLAYSLSKAALEKMTVALARDMAGYGVTVNLIAPGWFDTYRNADYFAKHGTREATGARLPAGRIGRPGDVEGLTLLLCGDEGEYITGQSIHIDGGMSL